LAGAGASGTLPGLQPFRGCQVRGSFPWDERPFFFSWRAPPRPPFPNGRVSASARVSLPVCAWNRFFSVKTRSFPFLGRTLLARGPFVEKFPLLAILYSWSLFFLFLEDDWPAVTSTVCRVCGLVSLHPRTLVFCLSFTPLFPDYVCLLLFFFFGGCLLWRFHPYRRVPVHLFPLSGPSRRLPTGRSTLRVLGALSA